MPALTLVLDLSASLYMGLVDAGGRVLSRRIRESARGETAHGLLDGMLTEAAAEPADIGDLAVGVGPGSFTGIRVGVALAQGLAFAGRLPLYPFSSLAAMLACVPGRGDAGPGAQGRAIAVIAANAGRYYLSAGRPPAESLASLPGILALAGDGTALITSGPVPDRARLEAAFAPVSRLEDAVDFALLARLAKSGPPVLDGVIRPNYLMASAAEEKRLAGGGPPAAGGGGGMPSPW